MKELKEQCLKSYPKGGLISDAIPEGGIISEIISNSNLSWQEIIEKINGDLDYIYEDILLGYDNMKNSTAAIIKARHFKKSFPLQPDIRTLQYWLNAVPKRRGNGKRRKGKR
ncbi:hypothetical protein MRB53_027600 [Persea americana]|uniref:Uncharacterized protein n=1 Tax=Persea americana TaxID=3435 RepID=A0ACC2LLH1_PERAE|nr:hypothetical protein MRB53_027600 [Persea americana]|eukprot:TRINITY_DN42672_c0_g1_i1.p1 TRINITY_DN42672_c0_g1~~TRINITY_DN42672_c0_g1_i1.p1  ORF type:complete len:112 (+),score=18.13 TRINITY_DN42672_c0_g1_i1:450-785(+)